MACTRAPNPEFPEGVAAWSLDSCDTVFFGMAIAEPHWAYHLSGFSLSEDGRALQTEGGNIWIGDAYPMSLHTTRADFRWWSRVTRVPWDGSRYVDEQGGDGDPGAPWVGEPWPRGEACRFHLGTLALWGDGLGYGWACTIPGVEGPESSRLRAFVAGSDSEPVRGGDRSTTGLRIGFSDPGPGGKSEFGSVDLVLYSGDLWFLGGLTMPEWHETAMECTDARCGAAV